MYFQLDEISKNLSAAKSFCGYFYEKDYADCVLTEQDTAEVSKFFKTFSQSSLNFCRCKLSDSLLDAILQGVSHNRNITYIQLEDVNLTETQLQRIIDFIETQPPHVNYINISKNSILNTCSEEILSALKTALKDNSYITQISVRFCDLLPEKEIEFGNLRDTLKSVHHLDALAAQKQREQEIKDNAARVSKKSHFGSHRKLCTTQTDISLFAFWLKKLNRKKSLSQGDLTQQESRDRTFSR